MKVIARLEYELAYYDSAVHRFNHYTTRTPIKVSQEKDTVSRREQKDTVSRRVQQRSVGIKVSQEKDTVSRRTQSAEGSGRDLSTEEISQEMSQHS